MGRRGSAGHSEACPPARCRPLRGRQRATRASRGDTLDDVGHLLGREVRRRSRGPRTTAPTRGEGRRKPLVEDLHEVPNKPHVVVHEGRMLRK